MRICPVMVAAVALLLPRSGYGADCSLKIVDIIRLKSLGGGSREIIPITINGTEKNFIFDTGGFLTQVARTTAEELQLPIRQG
ncbi:MAG TPA: aspartyl protease family protein, partial [Rhizomicrobium sp.]|nr:aspartyl protease family protein [Rhizomicrobium sp.]